MTTRTDLTIRIATPDDLTAVDALLARSYPALLRGDYPPSVMVTAVPLMARAQPALLASGSYFLALTGDAVVGAGGWTQAAPGGRPGMRGVGHVRHVATDPAHVRRGIGRALMETVILHARGSGMAWLHCLSTRTAVPFYRAQGFVVRGDTDVVLRPGISFPAVAMMAQI